MTNRQPSASVSLYKEVYGAGDPILCLHGLGANIYSWRHFIAPFSQNNRLILLISRAAEDRLKPLDTHYSTEEKVEDIYSLIRWGKPDQSDVGRKFSGRCSRPTGLRYDSRTERPDRLSKLVLIDSAGDKGTPPPHLKLLRSALGHSDYLPSHQLSFAALMTLRMCYYDRKGSRLGKCQRLRSASLPIAEDDMLYCTRPGSAFQQNADELIAEIATINVPTLILWGREDRVIP